MNLYGKRLIEHGFPCHQVGAETQRERGASSALPPLYYLHVWWARRPLTPSRAAILASLLPADTDPELFIRSLGIEKTVALVNGQLWTLTGALLGRVQPDGAGGEVLPVDGAVLKALGRENLQRTENLGLIEKIKQKNPGDANHPVLVRWEQESQLLEPMPKEGERLEVKKIMGDPAWAKEKLAFTKAQKVNFPGDAYGYNRAFQTRTNSSAKNITILDPTAGGGSIPFEALRQGCQVIANELNPVATVILHATLEFPAKYGQELVEEIKIWGTELLSYIDHQISFCFPDNQALPNQESQVLKKYLSACPTYFDQLNKEKIVDYIYSRQVTCPHCLGEAPLLNSCWLSKEEGDQWGVQVIPDGRKQRGTVRFVTYRALKGKGPNGEDPNRATVKDAEGTCVHCKQAISGEEIKAQARGESPLGQWRDRLYCVVATRFEPVLDKHGKPVRYQSGHKKGEIRTRKIRFFRSPNDRDLQALAEAERRLQEKWPEWEAQGLIPTEKFPEGNDNRPIYYGMPRWCDMFTPRQLLGHVTLVEGLNKLKPRIIDALGFEKGRAVVTYLQFMIDKGTDYNSRQTRWEYTRGIVKGNFGRHDFSLKWTFGEMIFTGPNSGAAWGLSQIIDAYEGMAGLMEPLHIDNNKTKLPLSIYNRTAAHLPEVQDGSVDLICIDPPYYNNVQYAELSDFFYVWQKRTLRDLYQGFFDRLLTNKKEEAVANPTRDGSAQSSKQAYERMMGEIFGECHRIIKNNGMLTIMFTHKRQEAWEALTQSLIQSHWIITSCLPVESESAESMHQKDMAAAASSIFLSCRKREQVSEHPALWTGFGGRGVQQQIRRAVEEGLLEFAPLRLNPVDEMVACYGRALRVLSEQWPVMDGDEPVGPLRAMNEASRVVAENQIRRLTEGRLSVDDLDPETALALTAFGIWGLNDFAFDEALNISRSLNISLTGKPAGYRVEGRMIGV
ncbi:MAG: DUF1156 domain-containing protein, partial [Deltaproteobacteria bacterium]|nr:DUF1156 domain-containing protein [Deltaproteobacteria bacterium]